MGAKAKKDTMNVTEAKNKFGELLDFAKTRPMKIEKNGRPVAVVISVEDAWWAKQAQDAAKEGFLGQQESEKFLAELMNSKD